MKNKLNKNQCEMLISQDDENRTPLMYACSSETNQYDVFKLFIDYAKECMNLVPPINILNAQDNLGRNAIDYARLCNNQIAYEALKDIIPESDYSGRVTIINYEDCPITD